jgi:predicted nucleotidyltransferase
MRRERALRYALEIARRLHAVQGFVATPGCEFDAYQISRVWVFGSTAKGSPEPNDLDILIDMHSVGMLQLYTEGRRLDKYKWKAYRIKVCHSGSNEVLKWLTKGMQKVSRHVLHDEAAVIDVKYLIYPRWELPDPQV